MNSKALTILALLALHINNASAAPTLVISEVMSSNKDVLADDDGDHSDWIEIHNSSDEAQSLKGYCLTDDESKPQKWHFPERTLASGAFLIVFASGKDRSGEILHTNFKLAAKGEYLGLVHEGLTLHAYQPTIPKLGTRQSYGLRFVKNNKLQLDALGILPEPSPGEPNADHWALPTTKDTKFDQDRGFYDEAFDVTITTGTPGATIRYTTDGSTPSAAHGNDYINPITITTTTTLRAMAFAEEHQPSDVDTQTYIFPKAVAQQSARPEGWPRTRPAGRGRGFFGFGRRGGGGSVPLDYAMAEPNSIDATEEEVIDALTAIPCLSIVTDQENLFDNESGIYANPSNRGRDWERPVSIELIDSTGKDKGFQWNAGLRIRGGHSRSPYCAKHSFRVYFRDAYGDGKLDYPLFGAEGVDEFDDIDLRTAQNYSYHYSDDGSQNTMVREVFSRDTQRDLGQPYARSRYYHLYLNGLYWGLYQSQEHTEASYGAHYFGGDAEDYDTLKVSRQRGMGGTPTDGTEKAWETLYAMANSIATEPSANKRLELYYEAQGLDKDGQPDAQKTVYLDAENLINYMLTIFYTGNFDAPITRFAGDRASNNWFGIFQREGRLGFQFFCHDSEHSLGSDGGEAINRVGPFVAGADARTTNPQWVHQQLMAVDTYREAFQARAEWALLDQDGPLTYQASVQRVDHRAKTVRKAILAECARWGDYKDQPSYTKADWEAAIERLKGVLKVRSAIVPEQLRTAQRFKDGEPYGTLQPAPLFNPVPTPVMQWQGDRGQFRLSDAANIFYTTDGSDPMSSDSANKATASRSVSRPILNAGSMLRAFVPKDNALKGAWTKLDFDDSKWRAGIGGAGYDLRGDYKAMIGIDLSEQMAGKLPAFLTRSLFEWDGKSMARMVLRLKFEDGFVAYLNGEEVASFNARNDREEMMYAQTSHSDDLAMRWRSFDISESLFALRKGTNVLAIQVMNDSPRSSDLLVYPELVAEDDVPGTEVVVAVDVQEIRARASANKAWGPLLTVPIKAGPTTEAAKSGLVVLSEIMYHPSEASDSEKHAGHLKPDAFEFIELLNVSNQPVDLSGCRFSKGIDYQFSQAARLRAGERLVLAKDRGAFEQRYGSKSRLVGLFRGGLKDSGETITLLASDGTIIDRVVYKDKNPWPKSADGKGASLILKPPGKDWQASPSRGGSPGQAD